jgi:tetratricopeptide (TPR) repeat protein
MAEGRKPSRQVRRAEARKKAPERKSFRLDRLVAPLLVAAGFVAYHNSLRGVFLFDDLGAIVRNPTIRTLWPPWSALSPPGKSPVTGRPLVNLSLAVNYAWGGLNVRSYHLFNVAVHILVALALFAVVRLTFTAPTLRAGFAGKASSIAAAVALLWVVHPLASESVDYTIQRTELLMSLFFLLTLYFAGRGFALSESKGWHVAALAAFALGLVSKEVIVVAPLVVFFYDWLFWSESPRRALARHWKLYAGFAVVFGLYFFTVDTNLRHVFSGANWLGMQLAWRPTVSPWTYALTQSGIIVHYLRLALWPAPLVGDYEGWPIAKSVADVLPSFLVVAGLVGLTFWGLVRRRNLAFLGVWFFAILAPTSSFRPLLSEIAAERRMYLPLAAVILLAVLAGRSLLRRLDAPQTAGTVVVALLALVLAWSTVRRNEDYRTTLSFWSDVVAKRPDNPRAHSWLGDYLFRNGRRADALAHLEEAVRLNPRRGSYLYSLGVVLASQGRTDEAIERYRESLRFEPERASVHNNLGVALASRGRLEEAVGHYREAIRIEPGHAGAHNNLARALVRQGLTIEAIEHFETALRLQPDFPSARRALEDVRRSLNP